MLLDLHGIIEIPGGQIPFSFTLSPETLCGGALLGFTAPPEATGVVRNCAGVLLVEGSLRGEMRCLCDRCGTEYHRRFEQPIEAVLAETDDNPDAFLLVNDSIDLTEVFSTGFILNMETKFLCREDCKGLCAECGKNLNDGLCTCTKSRDPRMAVLEQLLDK